MTRHRHAECTVPYEVKMTVYAHPDADIRDVREMVHEVAYAGGHLEPANPRFYGLRVSNLEITQNLKR